MFDAKIFIQSLHMSPREYSLSQLSVLFLSLSAYLIENMAFLSYEDQS
jgi:hypothetical protein